jgi:hypothetical protein
MSYALSRRRFRSSWYLRTVLAGYFFAIALLPLGHHDIACHLKSTSHCTSCVAASVADLTCDISSLDHLALDDAGRAMRDTSRPVKPLTTPTLSGRAPPAA